MKRVLIGILMVFATAPAAWAEGKAVGRVISYLSATSEKEGDATTSNLDMIALPDLGYEASTSAGDLEAYGTVRVQLAEEGSYTLLDQYVTLTWPGVQFYFGHEEFMDLTHSGTQYLLWVDNSHTAGDWGMEGGENILQATLGGLRLRYGINGFTEENTSEAYRKNYSSLSFETEGDISFALGVTAADSLVDADQSPTLVGGDLDGRAETSAWGGLAASWSEGSSLSLNLQLGTSQSGIASQDPAVESRGILILNQAVGSGGITLALGNTSTDDGSANPTLGSHLDLGWCLGLTDSAHLWTAYSATQTKDDDTNTDLASSEAALGLLYQF